MRTDEQLTQELRDRVESRGYTLLDHTVLYCHDEDGVATLGYGTAFKASDRGSLVLVEYGIDALSIKFGGSWIADKTMGLTRETIDILAQASNDAAKGGSK